MYQVIYCLTYEHDWRLVALGGAVCLLASAAAVSLFHRARAAIGGARVSWIALDAVVAGGGIWATHFIAMQAYGPGAGGAYNIPVTVLSLIFAIAVTFVGLSISVSTTRADLAAFGGAIVGGGVAAMHYTGMMALEIPAHVSWATGTVTASIVFGIVFGALALVVASRGDRLANALSATVLLTVAIVSHHFTAMGALELTADPSIVISGLSIPPASFRRPPCPCSRPAPPPRSSRSRLRRPCSTAAPRVNWDKSRSCWTPRSRTCRRDCACSTPTARSCCSTTAMHQCFAAPTCS